MVPKKLAVFYILLYKKVSNFPVPSRHVTNQTLPGREKLFPAQREFGKWLPSLGRENRRPCFTVHLKILQDAINQLIIFYCSSQGEFLQDIGEIIETISGIDHWWIGLSDRSGYKKLPTYNLHFVNFHFELQWWVNYFVIRANDLFFLQNFKIFKTKRKMVEIRNHWYTLFSYSVKFIML
jgi:hypothetical protein